MTYLSFSEQLVHFQKHGELPKGPCFIEIQTRHAGVEDILQANQFSTQQSLMRYLSFSEQLLYFQTYGELPKGPCLIESNTRHAGVEEN